MTGKLGSSELSENDDTLEALFGGNVPLQNGRPETPAPNEVLMPQSGVVSAVGRSLELDAQNVVQFHGIEHDEMPRFFKLEEYHGPGKTYFAVSKGVVEKMISKSVLFVTPDGHRAEFVHNFLTERFSDTGSFRLGDEYVFLERVCAAGSVDEVRSGIIQEVRRAAKL
ncbi:MAG: hypothetical protein U0519_05200 [Candidatus Gracilibacteria bacterium]